MTVKTRNRILDRMEYDLIYVTWQALLPNRYGDFSMSAVDEKNIRIWANDADHT